VIKLQSASITPRSGYPPEAVVERSHARALGALSPEFGADRDWRRQKDDCCRWKGE
jgi:hypothetical protein